MSTNSMTQMKWTDFLQDTNYQKPTKESQKKPSFIKESDSRVNNIPQTKSPQNE